MPGDRVHSGVGVGKGRPPLHTPLSAGPGIRSDGDGVAVGCGFDGCGVRMRWQWGADLMAVDCGFNGCGVCGSSTPHYFEYLVTPPQLLGACTPTFHP